MKENLNSHIILTGIPGTGKTTVGNYLQNNYGFTHYNFEDMEILNLFAKDKSGFITKCLNQSKVVISWGFMPYAHTQHIVEFKSRGFTLIWFDGNRDAALREFRKRGTVSEQAYQIQMSNIESSGVVKQIQPSVINTFNDEGQFKSLDDIIKEVLEV